MGQFSPRIVSALLRDRLHQLSFAVFGATVAFAIVALHAIDSQNGQVPGLTVTITYLLTLTSLAVLVVYVSHAGERLRASVLRRGPPRGGGGRGRVRARAVRPDGRLHTNGAPLLRVHGGVGGRQPPTARAWRAGVTPTARRDVRVDDGLG